MTGRSVIAPIDYEAGQLLSWIEVFNPEPQLSTERVTVRALWDTGAGISLIRRSIVRRLNLKEELLFNVNGAFGSGASSLAAAMVTLCIDGAAIPMPVGIVDDATIPGQWYDVVLGMPFISLGDFHVYHNDSRIEAKFIYKPLPPIDYLKLAKSLNRNPATQPIIRK